jgi:two-component system, NarL family, sensor histidine kinase DevS
MAIVDYKVTPNIRIPRRGGLEESSGERIPSVWVYNPAMAPSMEMRHLDAIHRVSQELVNEGSLDQVLTGVALAARQLAAARYAAIALTDEQGGVLRFITSGSTIEETSRLFRMPSGDNLISRLLKTKESIRLADLSQSIEVSTMPAGHPPLRAILSVPIISLDVSIGRLYLTDKDGGGEFSETDQKYMETLAGFAAVSIENARAIERLQASEKELAQRNQELAIFNDVSVAASTTLELEGILSTTLDRMMLHFNARCGEIFLTGEQSSDLRLELRKGDERSNCWDTDAMTAGSGFIGRVVASKDLLLVVDPPQENGFDQFSFQAAGLRMLIGIPLVSKGRVLGVMVLALREPMVLTERQKVLFEAVGLSVGTAIENGLLHRKSQRLAVLEERERIGMDLHDGIIQSIYAVGLMLEDGLLELGQHPNHTHKKLNQSIAALNEVIRDIRAYILDLRPQRLAYENLAAGLQLLVRDFRSQSAATVVTDISDEVARACPPGISNAFFHIAQEALANAARHAGATRVHLRLAREKASVLLTIEDNGSGFDPATLARSTGHGIDNMMERAKTVGGEVRILSEPGKGAKIQVMIQLANRTN